MAHKRGCGERVAGGLYLTTPLSDRGHRVECFILEPALGIEPGVVGLSAIGVTLFQDQQGTSHVLDWIGSEFYPNPADFIEETRHLGMSRRIGRNQALEQLGPGSKVFCLHSRARMDRAAELIQRLPQDYWHECPGVIAQAHCGRGSIAPHGAEPCGRWWWHDVMEVGADNWRVIGETSYRASPLLADGPRGYGLGVFMVLPIARVEVVRDREDPTRESRALETAQKSQLPVVLVDE